MNATMKNDNLIQQIPRRGNQKPLTLLPEEKLEEVASRLPKEEELATRLIYRTANTKIFRLKWQDVERTPDGWNIQIEDREAFIDEEKILQEIEKKKQANLPLLNTTKEKLSDKLPEEIKVSHLRFGGLANLLENKSFIQAHKRTGFAPHTLDKYSKLFIRQEIIQLDSSVYKEELDSLSTYLKEEKEELTFLSDDDLERRILPESGLDQLCGRLQRKSHEFATRLMYRGGLRPGEVISNLNWEDIERKVNELEVEVQGRTTRTVTVKGEKLLKLYEELQENLGQLFEFNIQKYESALRQASEGEITAYRLRASKVHHLVNEENASAERLSDEFGFSLQQRNRG